MARQLHKQQQRLFFVFKYISSIKNTGRLPQPTKFNCTKSNIDYWARKLIDPNLSKMARIHA